MNRSVKTLNLHDVTALGRPLDFRYPSNIFAAGMSVVGGMVGGLLALSDNREGFGVVYFALVASLSVFVAWALTRELDPDYPASAGVASGVALAGIILWQPEPNLIGLYLMLVLLRGLIRTVGIPLRFGDMVLLVFGAGVVAMTNAWILGLVVAAGLILDSQLPAPNKIAQSFGGAAILVTLVIAVLMQDFSQRLAGNPATLVLLLGVSGFYYWAIRTAASPISMGDISGQPLVASRLKSAQLLALVGVWMEVLWTGGEDGMQTLLALWSAFAAIGIFAAYRRVKH